MPVFPINFSISSKHIVKEVPEKTRILAPIIPGDTSTYVYDTENEYYQMYKESCFAVTTKKAGWDCMRHYEILANGCIPLFFGLEDCPDQTLTTMPKQLLKEIYTFYFTSLDTKKSIDDLTDYEMSRIKSYTEQLLDYTRTYLTNEYVARYIVQTTIPRTSVNTNTKILFLSGELLPDYLRCTVLAGLKKLYGKDCHDYPKIPHLYDTYEGDTTCLYGKGFTYTKMLQEDSVRENELDNNIEDCIRNRFYDLIIYGSVHRGLPYWGLVNQYYTNREIVLLCGEDHPHCDFVDFFGQEYNMFIRELDAPV